MQDMTKYRVVKIIIPSSDGKSDVITRLHLYYRVQYYSFLFGWRNIHYSLFKEMSLAQEYINYLNSQD